MTPVPRTLREDVAALAETWEGWAAHRSTTRIGAFRDAAEQIRDLLAAHPAAAEPTGHRRGADDGFHVGYHQFVTHADYTALTDALGYGDDRAEPAATPAELVEPLRAALDAQHEHYECEQMARDEACRRGEEPCGIPECDHVEPTGQALETVIAAHALDIRPRRITPGGNPACRCGWVGLKHAAHVAAAVRAYLEGQ